MAELSLLFSEITRNMSDLNSAIKMHRLGEQIFFFNVLFKGDMLHIQRHKLIVCDTFP